MITIRIYGPQGQIGDDIHVGNYAHVDRVLGAMRAIYRHGPYGMYLLAYDNGTDASYRCSLITYDKPGDADKDWLNNIIDYHESPDSFCACENSTCADHALTGKRWHPCLRKPEKRGRAVWGLGDTCCTQCTDNYIAQGYAASPLTDQ